MKTGASRSKLHRKTADRGSQQSFAGDKAVALAPPNYGIEFVDRSLAAGPVPDGTGIRHRLSPGIEALTGAAIASPCLQPKLTLSAPGDAYEQEANSVADHLILMPHIVAASGEWVPQQSATRGNTVGQSLTRADEGGGPPHEPVTPSGSVIPRLKYETLELAPPSLRK